ncbi:hypothetical protein EW026_g7144 [Hermanssonia centrifuga]|uniref:Uncharacterized protein n=1 Tax=Hermanssonia centrifuga TaxID=98765 RepID=A0A4V3X9I0_9APHY|nr:hypothetical protein EW026_g7144 [Hermanssonia centrifuga]
MTTHPSASETPYTRHRAARLLYQNRYNNIKRTCGKRKMSKHDRETLEERREAELKGIIPEVINPIVRKSSAVDPERTSQMAGDEDFINGECMDLKLFLLHNPDNDNMATFTQKIEGYIESYHSWAIAYLQTSSGSPNTETIHAYRRKIAVLHEFLDLHRQGHDAFALASAWGKTVYSGRSVKKTVFKTLYGF